MNKYIAEFIGTFFLVLSIGLNVLPGPAAPLGGALAPLAIGMTLMVMVYAGGHVSGAHYNPAVTLAVFLRGKCPGSDVLPYMLAQVLGAACGALMAVSLLALPTAEPGALNVGRVLVAEGLFTFALAYVVLSVATAKSAAGNSYFGLAIGSTVMIGAFAVGGISGAAFNPAVAVGVVIMGLSSLTNIWVYLIANFGAAALAAVAFRVLNPDDR